MRRAAVTGMGAICCAGTSPAAVAEAVFAGRSGLAPIRAWDAAGWPCGLGGEAPPLDPRGLVPDRKAHKLLSRPDLLGLYAARQAVESSGVLSFRDSLGEAERAAFNERTAVVAGTGGANYLNQYDFFPLLDRSGEDLRTFGAELVSSVSPMWLLRILPNNVLCHSGVFTGFKGPNANFTSHSLSGSLAILEALRLLGDGEADRALVVGADCPLEPQVVLHFARLGLLAESAIRPFDAAREGSLLGEGAAALVLETPESAAARGARSLGHVLGGAVSAEGEGLLSLREDGEGVVRAVRAALLEAGLEPSAVSLIAAHGNGTERSDLSEGRALLEVFGAPTPPVTAFKWAVGHLIAASGLMEAVLALLALGRRSAPGISTLRHLDPALSGLSVSREPREAAPGAGVLVGRSFAGLSSALVLEGLVLEGE